MPSDSDIEVRSGEVFRHPDLRPITIEYDPEVSNGLVFRLRNSDSCMNVEDMEKLSVLITAALKYHKVCQEQAAWKTLA